MNQCEFCLETFPPIKYFFHSIWQFFCMFIVLIKFTIWSLYITNFKLRDEAKFPCTSCKHSGQVHLVIPAEDAAYIGINIEPSILAFHNYTPSYPLEQQLCLQCAIHYVLRLGKIGSDIPPDHGYNKMDNLSYLEMKAHEKKV